RCGHLPPAPPLVFFAERSLQIEARDRVARIPAGTIVTITELGPFITRLRAAGKTIFFTNGVFDLLHPGHVRYLEHARALGDVLIVGVNSDRSVRSNKGPGRPITVEAERVELLEALA